MRAARTIIRTHRNDESPKDNKRELAREPVDTSRRHICGPDLAGNVLADVFSFFRSFATEGNKETEKDSNADILRSQGSFHQPIVTIGGERRIRKK